MSTLFRWNQLARDILNMFAVMLVALSFQANAQESESTPTPYSKPYIERTLSTHYEKMAEQSLRFLAGPDKAKIFVDVRLDPSVDLDKSLAEFQNEPLPGTIRTHQPDEDEFLGKLETLPHNRSILLLLAPELKAEQETLIKETLTGKLRLNLTGDIDKIAVKRGEIFEPGQERMPASDPTESLQKISPWTIAGIAIGAIFVIAVLLLLLKNRKNQNEERNDFSKPSNTQPNIPADASLNHELNVNQKNSQNPVAPQALTVEMVNRYRAKNVEEVLENVTSIASQFPGISSKAIEKLSKDPQNLVRLAALFELLGHKQSIALFKGVSKRVWSDIGHHMSESPLTDENPVSLDDLAIVYRAILAFVVEKKGNDDMSVKSSPLMDFEASALYQALQGEKLEEIICIISMLPNTLSNDIIVSFPKDERVKIISAMSRGIKTSPADYQKAEQRILNKLQGKSLSFVAPLNNDQKIFSALAQLSPFEEEAMFFTLFSEDETVLERARPFRIYPQHLAELREDILREEIANRSGEEIAKLLRGLNSNVQDNVFSVLSEKKQAQVESILEELSEGTMTREFADSRRQFLDYLYNKYIAGNTAMLNEFFVNSNQNSEAA